MNFKSEYGSSNSKVSIYRLNTTKNSSNSSLGALNGIESSWLISCIEERILMLEDYFFNKEANLSKKASLGNTKAERLLSQQDHLNTVNSCNIFLFNEGQEPQVSPSQLMQTLVEAGDYSPQAILVGFILLERYIEQTKIRGRINLHYILGAACFVALKFLEDKEVWFFEDYSMLSLIPEDTCR